MITIGIITSVICPASADSPARYKILIPVFDGMPSKKQSENNVSAEGVACCPPHASVTYHENDAVYIAIKDYDLSQIVILGMIPHWSDTQYKFKSAENTESYMSQEFDNIVVHSSAQLVNPSMCDDDGNAIVNPRDFRVLQGAASIGNLRAKLEIQDTEISNLQGQSGQASGLYYRDGEIFSTVTVDTERWISKTGGLLSGEFIYRVTPRQHGWIYNGQDVVIAQYGITVPAGIMGVNNDSIKVQYGGALDISAGGTGATTAVEARENLGIKVTSISNFSPEPNTLYFLY